MGILPHPPLPLKVNGIYITVMRFNFIITASNLYTTSLHLKELLERTCSIVHLYISFALVSFMSISVVDTTGILSDTIVAKFAIASIYIELLVN